MSLHARAKLVTTLCLAGLLFTTHSRLGAVASSTSLQQAFDSISISAVVLDRSGFPVRNVKATDLTLREDGKPVSLTTFNAINAADAASEGRMIVLLLGGQGGDPEITLRYKHVAELFLAHGTDRDTVAVVRMQGSDEVAGNRSDMRMRLAEFRANYGEPFNEKTFETVLERMVSIADQFKEDDQRRKAIVCIGASYAFNVSEPRRRQYELLWPHWVKALNALARANASVYVIDPKGLDGRTTLNPDGLVAQTGGLMIENSNDFNAAVDRVWRETGNYYTLGYAPEEGQRELHAIDVKPVNPTWRVRVRRSR
ncbi:MAG TPA: hypothetical protein VF456_00840 [Vicinamibacterales bacterium]